MWFVGGDRVHSLKVALMLGGGSKSSLGANPYCMAHREAGKEKL